MQYLFLSKQAYLVTATSHTAEFSGLKQNLERAEEELGHMRKQLEESKGMYLTLSKFRCSEQFVLTEVSYYLLGATTEAEALKRSLAEAEDRVAKEKATHVKHEARVSEIQQELPDAVKKYESLESDFKD